MEQQRHEIESIQEVLQLYQNTEEEYSKRLEDAATKYAKEKITYESTLKDL